jgi:hypothetical protein
MDDNPWRYHIVQIHGPDQHSFIPALLWGYGIYDSHKERMRDLPIMRTRIEAEEKLAQLDPHRELSMDHHV